MLVTRTRFFFGLGMLAAAAAALVPLVGTSADRAQAAFPGENGRIAFYGQHMGGPAEIYTVAPNGGHVDRLTKNSDVDDNPAYSPNGNWIAFDTNRDGDFEIFKMRPGGGDKTRLTKNHAADFDPAWSPSGRRLVFASKGELYIMGANGNHRHQLTSLGSPGTFSAAWSPNGNKIAFQSIAAGDFEVFTINPDGSHLNQLTHNKDFDGDPNYSPSGRRIAYDSSRGAGPRDQIFAMKPDGRHKRQVSHRKGGADGPAYSPNGKRIAFYGTVKGEAEIFTMTAGGGDQTRLTDNNRGDFVPDWQPR